MNDDLATIRAALAALQQQVDMLTTAHDARAEAAQVALDDLRDIVCDPTNPRNHESRLTAVEVRTDRVETEQTAARGERRGILDALPSGEEVGKLGDGIRRVGLYGVVIVFGLALVYLVVFGDPIGAFERVWKIVNPPVTVTVDRPVPVVNVPPDTASAP